ncbi:hypothetical protein TELCIR_23878, partial [Teladorsagia circumcincta]
VKQRIRKGKELEHRQTTLEAALNSSSSAADAANLTELKYLQNAALQQSSDYYTVESLLMTLREVNEKEHEKMHKNLQDFKKEMADKIDELLELKTPCALTKVDMINTIRKEYQSFQDAQKGLESQRPIPVTATELKELAGSYSDLDKRIDRVEVMLNQRMDKIEETLESTKQQQNETLQSLKEAMETIQKTLLSSFSSSSSSSPATSSKRPYATAPSTERSKTPPEARAVSRTRPQRDSSAIEQKTSSRRATRDTEPINRPLLAALSNQELKEKISSLDRKIAAINKAMEDALRSTAEGSKRRHEQLRQEKTGLYKSTDFYEEQLRCRERNRSRSRSRRHGHCSRRQRTPSRSQHRGNGGHSSSRPSTSGWGV